MGPILIAAAGGPVSHTATCGSGCYCDQSARGPFDVCRDLSGIVPTLCVLRRSTSRVSVAGSEGLATVRASPLMSEPRKGP